MARVSSLSFLILSLSWGAVAETPKAPGKWESSIAGLEARDAASAPPSSALLFVGSSSIRMWDLPTSWPNEATINNGFGGSTLADSIHFFDRLISRYDPKAVILYAGDNDISNGLSPEQVAQDFETLASSISAVFPRVPVIYIAIKPSRARWNLWPKMRDANDRIATLCERKASWFFADIATPMLKGQDGAPAANWFLDDGLHLSAFGYESWTAVVNSVLEAAGVPH